MYIFALQAASDGLTLREVLADLPHDPAALFVYAVVGLSIYVLWRANRGTSGTAQEHTSSPNEDPTAPTSPRAGVGA